MSNAIVTGWITTLWSGRKPLPEAFWHFGIVTGFIVNLIASLAALVLFTTDAPDWLAATIHFAPVPYNLLVLVGVWRSAARWRGEGRWADLARLVITLWVIAATMV